MFYNLAYLLYNYILRQLTQLYWQEDDPSLSAVKPTAETIFRAAKRHIMFWRRACNVAIFQERVVNMHSLVWQAHKWSEFTFILWQDKLWWYADAVMTFLSDVITAPGTFNFIRVEKHIHHFCSFSSNSRYMWTHWILIIKVPVVPRRANKKRGNQNYFVSAR